MDIIIVGCVSSRETMELFDKNRAALETKYSVEYLKTGINRVRSLVRDFGEDALIDVCKGQQAAVCIIDGLNLYDALWELGESFETGLRVVLEEVPIDRFSVELGDFLDENPYLWDSTGCALIVCNNSRLLCEKLKESGFPAKIIGYFSEDNGRCIVNNGNLTYIGSK